MTDLLNTLVVPNGINGLTGDYDLPPLEIDALADLIRGTAAEDTPAHVVERGRRLVQPAFHRGCRGGWSRTI